MTMTKKERLIFLIQTLLKESPEYQNTPIPKNLAEQRMLFRALMNVRAPKPIDENFIQVQNEYLQEVIEEKGVTDLHDLTPVKDNLYVWQGDITTLRCDAIVNAANSQMTGCYIPGHACIDNCIHTYAGVQLRYDCFQKMQKQGFGAIVNTASIGGYKMAPGFAAYGPAKAAVIALTEMAALENATFGIRVNAICPGPTMGTELTKNSLSTNPHEEEMLKEHVIPMKKLAMTQEVVNAVLWLSSEEASHTTGQKIFIDGGMHIA